MSFSRDYFLEADIILGELSKSHLLIDEMASRLANLRGHGRLFILGVGGSAGNASHAVNDFRKLCEIEAYAPTDNVSELTARTNDEGFHTVFYEWLKVSKLSSNDAILIFSVGGGNLEKQVSVNLMNAIDLAKEVGAGIFGIVGMKGYTFKEADICILVPPLSPERITPHSEAFQAIIWHCLVSNPILQLKGTKW